VEDVEIWNARRSVRLNADDFILRAISYHYRSYSAILKLLYRTEREREEERMLHSHCCRSRFCGAIDDAVDRISLFALALDSFV